MKTLKLFIGIILFCLLSPTITQAQVEVSGTEVLLSKLRLNKDIEGRKNNTYQVIAGNPFMFKDFENGSIKLKDDGIYTGELRFDKYAGEIHFKKDEEIYAIAFPEKIEYIEIEGIRFIYSDYQMSKPEPTIKGTYFIDLVDNQCKLLVKKGAIIKEAVPSRGIVDAKPARFMDKSDSYFVKIGDNPAIEIKNKKSLVSIFNNKALEIKRFLDTEKISIRNQEDLVKLVNYYNTLISSN